MRGRVLVVATTIKAVSSPVTTAPLCLDTVRTCRPLTWRAIHQYVLSGETLAAAGPGLCIQLGTTEVPSSQLQPLPLAMAGWQGVIILAERLSAALLWQTEAEAEGRCPGGWSFKPGQVKALLITWLGPQLEANARQQLETAMTSHAGHNRRRDERLALAAELLALSLDDRDTRLAEAGATLSQLHEQLAANKTQAALGRLSARIAHEIRNPLGVLDVYAGLIAAQAPLLAQEPDDLKRQAMASQLALNASVIQEAIAGLDTLLGDLNRFGKPVRLVRRPIDIAALVEEVARFFTPACEARRVKLLTEHAVPAGISTTLPADKDRLVQVLRNLVKNAMEATPEGGQITLALSARDGDRHLWLKVRDTGTGIPEKLRQEVFEPHISAKAGGTGLGLAEARKLMAAHGGELRLLDSDDEGPGATFACLLPVS